MFCFSFGAVATYNQNLSFVVMRRKWVVPSLVVFAPLVVLCYGVGWKRRLEASPLADVASGSAGPVSSPVGDVPRGGVRQRLRATDSATAASSNSVPPTELPFNDDLKRDWAKGLLSSAQVQRYAMHSMQQCAVGLEELAAIGTGGKHAQNLMRDLVRVFGTPVGAPQFDWYEIPTKRGPRTPIRF